MKTEYELVMLLLKSGAETFDYKTVNVHVSIQVIEIISIWSALEKYGTYFPNELREMIVNFLFHMKTMFVS